MAQDQEVIFLSEDGIRVTNTRFVLPNQTFAMSGITSVQSDQETPSRTGPIIVMFIGLICLINESFGVGMVFIGVAGLILYGIKTNYHVLLHTASGEAKALSSTNKEWIEKVVHALHESIVHRG